MTSMQDKWGLLGMWVLLCLSVGWVSSAFTVTAIDGWYVGLVKPWFSPPNWVFGPVWTVLYVLMGAAAWRIHSAKASAARLAALRWFVVQLALNFAWSIAFFGLQSPLFGLITLLLLLVAIGGTIATFWRVDRTAAWLLVPYLAWVTFATALNAALLYLNT